MNKSVISMNNMPSLRPEAVQLCNRVGRPLNVDVQCLSYRNRYYVVLMARQDLPGNQLLKNAEHLARQLIDCMGVSPSDVDFIQYQPREEPEWLRWRFQWVGNSPLKAASYPINSSSQKSFLQPLLSEGVTKSLASFNEQAVA